MSIQFYNSKTSEINFTDSNDTGFYCNQGGSILNLFPVAAEQFVYKSTMDLDVPESECVQVYSTGSRTHVLFI